MVICVISIRTLPFLLVYKRMERELYRLLWNCKTDPRELELFGLTQMIYTFRYVVYGCTVFTAAQ